MLDIRVMQPKDAPFVRELLLNTYETSVQADLVDKLRKASFYDKELALIALKEDKIIGHILFTRLVIKHNTQNYPGLVLALCSVLPEFQKQGIGTQLMEQGLKKCKYLGYKIIFVSGQPNYFSRFNFNTLDSETFTLGLNYALDMPLVHLLTEDAVSIKGNVLYPREFINN